MALRFTIFILACLLFTACIAFFTICPNTEEVNPTPSNVSLVDSVEVPSGVRSNMVEVNSTPTNMSLTNVSLELSSSGGTPRFKGHFGPFGPPSKELKTRANWVARTSSTAKGNNRSRVDKSKENDMTSEKSLPRPPRPRSPNAPPNRRTPPSDDSGKTPPHPGKNPPPSPLSKENPSPYKDSGNNPPSSPHSKENPSPHKDSGNNPPPSPYGSENPPPSDDSPENREPIFKYSDEKPPPSNSAIQEGVQVTTKIKANLPKLDILAEGWIRWRPSAWKVSGIIGMMAVVGFLLNVCLGSTCFGLWGLYQRLVKSVKQNEQNSRRRRRNGARGGGGRANVD